MVVVLDEESVISRFASLIAEDRCYKISHFAVQRNAEGKTKEYHIKLLQMSHLTFADDYLPKHCFNLQTVSHVLCGMCKPGSLVGIYI